MRYKGDLALRRSAFRLQTLANPKAARFTRSLRRGDELLRTGSLRFGSSELLGILLGLLRIGHRRLPLNLLCRR